MSLVQHKNDRESMESPNRKTKHDRKTNVYHKCLGAKARLVILVTNVLDLHMS